MRLINFTPHTINIYGVTGEHIISVQPEATPARCAVVSEDAGAAGDVPLFRTKFGAVTGLPEPQLNTLYIVSMIVRQAYPHRDDLASPGELIRDVNGQPVGCRGLVVN